MTATFKPEAQTRSVFSISLIFLAANLLAAAAYFYLYVQSQAWQILGIVAISLTLAVAGATSAWFTRRGRHTWAVGLLIGITWVGGLSATMLIAGIGAWVGAMVVLTSLAIATQASFAGLNRVLMAGVVAGVAAAVPDLLGLSYRLSLPQLQDAVPLLSAVTVIAFGVLIARQFQTYPLQTKLVITFLLLTIFTVGVVAFVTDRMLRNALTQEVGASLTSLAGSKASEIGAELEHELNLLRVLAANEAVQQTLAQADATPALSQAEIERLDQQWRTAVETGNDADPLVARVLTNGLAVELRAFQAELPQHLEIFATNRQGVTTAAPTRISDYYRADEAWWQTAFVEGAFVGQPEMDESSQTISFPIAVAVKGNATGETVGVLHTTVNANVLIEPLVTGRFGKSGHVHISLPGDLEIHLMQSPEVSLMLAPARLNIDELVQASASYQEIRLKSGDAHLASQAPVTGAEAQVINQLGWRIAAHQQRADALQAVEDSARITLLVALGVLLLAGIVALLMAQLLSRPITRLTAAAAKVSGGDLTAQAPVETNDEIGALATTFNVMTTQLRETLEGLEQRVAERTKALRTTIEVSRRISTAMDRGTLATQVVEQLQSAFGYYHAHIYFFDAERQNLVMVSGTGEAGRLMLERGHRLPSGRGLVGRAAERNQPMLVPDTARDPQWLPNPLLPDTRAEVAVPIASGEQVYGVLDVQQNAVNGLTQEDADLLQALANQVAIALQNAQSFERARESAALEAQVNAIGQKIQSTTTVEAALQIAARELGRALGGARTRVRVRPTGGNGAAERAGERADTAGG